HVRSLDFPSNEPIARNAETNASCTASSRSCSRRMNLLATAIMRGPYSRTSVSNARSSPAFNRAIRSASSASFSMVHSLVDGSASPSIVYPMIHRTCGIVCILVLAARGLAQETQRQYLSGKGIDDAVQWEFFCSAGDKSGQWTTIRVPTCWDVEGFGTL